MFVALTGTPGTGKTTVAELLSRRGFTVLDVKKLAVENGFILGSDDERGGSLIVDTDSLSEWVMKRYGKQGGSENIFGNTDRKDADPSVRPISENYVFLEGHVAHLMECCEVVVILRCDPKILYQRLSSRGWPAKKIEENVDAEALDVILCEALEYYENGDVFEIDGGTGDPEAAASAIIELANAEFKKESPDYMLGKFDWSDYLLEKY
ncbi:MAG: NMP kinase [Thermoplasmata archaeon HGW-Thermoplasmata-1]|nr:MAG: NMP kinase [Thermoplasmata archaeon HGW-Thermoplasmata-1]